MEGALFFRLNSLELGLILFAIVFGATAIGVVLGRLVRHRSEHLREPFGVLQAALLGLVGLVLAFGLALAVGRYEARRAAVVDDANAIGTTYLRAQTLAEPLRTRSLELLKRYTDTDIRLSDAVPGSAGRGSDRRRRRCSSASSGGSPDRRSPAAHRERAAPVRRQRSTR